MAIQGQWLNSEKTILIFTLQGRWTWQEATEIVREQVQMLGTVNHKVHTIYDLRDGKHLPQGGALQSLRDIMMMTHPNEDLIILIGSGGFLKALIEVISSTYGLRNSVSRYHYVNTLEPALDIIAQHENNRASRAKPV